MCADKSFAKIILINWEKVANKQASRYYNSLRESRVENMIMKMGDDELIESLDFYIGLNRTMFHILTGNYCRYNNYGYYIYWHIFLTYAF